MHYKIIKKMYILKRRNYDAQSVKRTLAVWEISEDIKSIAMVTNRPTINVIIVKTTLHALMLLCDIEKNVFTMKNFINATNVLNDLPNVIIIFYIEMHAVADNTQRHKNPID
jgi:hypothetical protein